MKRIYLIGGTMGVGKTSVCRTLKKELKNTVFLVLGCCSVYDNVIFCRLMHEPKIIDDILSNLDLANCDVKTLSLICNRNEPVKRFKKDIIAGIRQEDVIARSIERLSLYAALNTVKVDMSNLSVEQTAEKITSAGNNTC